MSVESRQGAQNRPWVFVWLTLVGLTVAGMSRSALRAADPAPSAAESEKGAPGSRKGEDLLQFLDGAALHGELQAMSVSQGVTWKHPNARHPIDFKPTNLAWIRFERPTPVTLPSKPTCRFRFHNGDEVFGDLTAMDSEKVTLRSWFGGELTTPRSALQSLTFLSKGYAVLYEGPTSAEGWVQGKSGRGWEYRDGMFIATGMGTLGRDLKLAGSSSVSFDLAWNGQFSLILALYASVFDRFDYSSSSYMFYFSPGYVSLQRVQGGAGAMNLGQTAIGEMSRKSRLHVEIRSNKDDGTLGLLVEDRLVQRWKDASGFLAQGSGIVFFAQLEGPSVRISNLKVAQWEGDLGQEGATNVMTKDDLVYLVNRDRVAGRVQSLREGTLSVTADQTALEVPLTRVNQIFLASQTAEPAPASPWELRAYFAGGGTIAFGLAEWQQGHVSGRSGNFGEVSFDSQHLRQLQFNLDRSKGGPADLEILDPDVWDFE